MARQRLRRLLVSACALALAARACAAPPPAPRHGGDRGGAPPGVATIARRDGSELELRLDAGTEAADLLGRPLVVRRLARSVLVPLATRAFAQEWEENGVARVLPPPLGPPVDGGMQGGAPLAARLTWEDVRHAVREGDRAEPAHLGAPAARLARVSLRALSSEGEPAAPTVVPGQALWLEACAVCLTGQRVEHHWSADAGQFLLAGGTRAGAEFRGPAVVRWRAPVASATVDPVGSRATIRVRATAGGAGQGQTAQLDVAIVRGGPYRRVSWAPTMARVAKDSPLGPALASVAFLAAGAPGAFYCVDSAQSCLVWWGRDGPRYAPCGDRPVDGLNTFGGAVYCVQGGNVSHWRPGGGAPAFSFRLKGLGRLVDLEFGRAGDAFALDRGRAPCLWVLEGSADKVKRQLDPVRVDLEPAIEPAAMGPFCVDPASGDLFVLDTAEGRIRWWRSRQARAYRPVEAAVAAGGEGDAARQPVALVARANCDRARDLPLRVVFGSGAVSRRWTPPASPRQRGDRGGGAGSWAPVVAGPAPELAGMAFKAHAARGLPEGDLLLAGKGTVAGAERALLAQVSPDGELRRMLPLPQMPPGSVAVAPDGSRYLLLHSRHRRLFVTRHAYHVARLGPDGWMTRDLGPLEDYWPIVRLRPDRASSRRFLLVSRHTSMGSVVRFDVGDRAKSVDLTALPDLRRDVPSYRKFVVVDADSTPEHVVVLGRLKGQGTVLLLANSDRPHYLTYFHLATSRPLAIAAVAGVRRSAAAPEPYCYVCVLSSRGGRGIEVCEFNPRGFGRPTVRRIGVVAAAARPVEPVAIVSGFPDRPGTVYVLDRGRDDVRGFDIAEAARRIKAGRPAELDATPVLADLGIKRHTVDLAIGPGQVVHLVDETDWAITTYARRP